MPRTAAGLIGVPRDAHAPLQQRVRAGRQDGFVEYQPFTPITETLRAPSAGSAVAAIDR
ncbi:hypothetical protein [Nonomuraea dietziae]|uniref:hypothetical protein n=1 Tax=Nonomuraea dietziae TaxID=65515 RepID=UPI0033F9AC96